MYLFQLSSDDNHKRHCHYFIVEETGLERIELHILKLKCVCHVLNSHARGLHVSQSLVREFFKEQNKHKPKQNISTMRIIEAMLKGNSNYTAK